MNPFARDHMTGYRYNHNAVFQMRKEGKRLRECKYLIIIRKCVSEVLNKTNHPIFIIKLLYFQLLTNIL